MEYTIVVVASASDPAPMQYIAPYSGCAMAEYFMYTRESRRCACTMTSPSRPPRTGSCRWCFVVRLAARRTPATSSTCTRVSSNAPAKLREDTGIVDNKTIFKPGGSLTALPIIETQAGDVSAYIPTNVISITDGQIFLESDLFFAGTRPAINVGISVSRVGGSAQVKAMRSVAGRLRLDLAQFRELEAFSAFASDLDAATKRQLERGARTVEVLKQPQYSPMPVEQQVMIIYAVTNGHLDDVPVKRIREWERPVPRVHGRSLLAGRQQDPHGEGPLEGDRGGAQEGHRRVQDDLQIRGHRDQGLGTQPEEVSTGEEFCSALIASQPSPQSLVPSPHLTSEPNGQRS
jgi:F-type H+-transporting ATPase subunit alpha